MKNSLEDLHNHMMAQVERLSDEGVKGKDLEQEIGRARAISNVAATMIENGRLVLDAQRVLGGPTPGGRQLPKMLQGQKSGQ